MRTRVGPAVRWLAGIFGVAALTVLAVSAVFDPGEIEAGRHLETVGVSAEPCPGCGLCGLSRAFSAVSHLDVRSAIEQNAAVIWTYPLAALSALAGPWIALKGF
jgi:hypothetical protein